MTLVELLVAMSIAAILMLGGVAAYWRMNRGFALRAATSGIEASLRSARHFAIHERGPAVVVAEPRPDEPGLIGLVYALGRQTVSCWHFETQQFAGTKVLGALGQEAAMTGTATPAPGRIGSALPLDGGTSLQVTSPYLDGLREGVFVECFVKPQPAADGTVMPIVSKDTGASAPFWLALVAAGGRAFGIQGGAKLADGTAFGPVATPALVPAGEWTHVAMACYRDGRTDTGSDRFVLTLSINGEEAARNELEGSNLVLAPSTAPVHIGSDGSNYFVGLIDELKIAGLVAGEAYKLPRNTEVTLDPGGSHDGRVHFDREGKLDPEHHSGPVLFRVVSTEDRLLRTIRVSWLGSVEVFNGAPPAE